MVWSGLLFLLLLLLLTAAALDESPINLSALPSPTLFRFLASEPAVNIMHIPKTAGSSFREEVNANHAFPSYNMPHTEFCHQYMRSHYGNASQSYLVSFFRTPRSHVYSQYLECKYDPLFIRRTKDYNFPRPKSHVKGFKVWINHFYSSWNQVMDERLNITHDHFNCYHPYNMQTRYLAQTCPRSAHNIEDNMTWKTVLQAIEIMNSLPFIGLTEYYNASMCLFWFYVQKPLLWQRFCSPKPLLSSQRVATEAQGTSSKSKTSPQEHMHITHFVPKHSLEDIDEKTWLKVDALTRLDQVTYRYAVRRFFFNVQHMEVHHNISLRHLLPMNHEFVLSLLRDQ